MGIQWSSRVDFYVHEYKNPRLAKETTQVTVKLRVGRKNAESPLELIWTEPDAFRSLLGTDARSAVILDISQKQIINELETPIILSIKNLFDGNEDFRVICPGKKQINVPANEQLIYRSKLNEEHILKYAGTEYILKSDVHDDDVCYECFQDSHPMTAIIMSEGKRFEPQDDDIRRKISEKTQKPVYIVRKRFAEKVRDFLRDAVFNEMNYTDFSTTTVSVQQPPELKQEMLGNSVFVFLDISYIIVSPGKKGFIHTEEQLK